MVGVGIGGVVLEKFQIGLICDGVWGGIQNFTFFFAYSAAEVCGYYWFCEFLRLFFSVCVFSIGRTVFYLF
jgi:hypothetical protein